MVKQLVLVLVIASAFVLSGWAEKLPAPLQSHFDEWLGPMLGAESPEFITFQAFATALVRNDIKTVTTMTDDDDVKDHASRASVSLRRRVRDVLQVAYRIDREQRSADGKNVTLEVSQGLTLDPPGVTSAFGTMWCEGRYEVTMVEKAGVWKIASLTFQAPEREPTEPKMLLGPGDNATWPCADSAWTEFATAWKSTMMK